MNIPLSKKSLMAMLPSFRAGEAIMPVGTLEITENGLYDVRSYAMADVSLGLKLFGRRFTCGSFTPEADTKGSAISIYHNLGTTPGVFILWCADFFTAGTTGYTELGCMYIEDSFQGKFLRCANSSGKTIITGTSNLASNNITSEYIVLPETASSAYYRPGYTYRWIAIA